ncbi:MAG: TonB-dependent receptor [Chitinophagaceae bacterium]|nr:TonB-dependent receptor [Chitinophagaceae bacterium]
MKKSIFMVAAAMIGSHLLQAQDSTGKVLDEIILTANKYPKKQSETGKVTTVINRQQLEKSNGKTIGELLNAVAGTTIIGANNNAGTNLTTSIRGASAGNTLILVDGIPVTDPSVNNNYFDLNFFSIDQIERIEILKGGQSTLYGSDAVAGVINIITKKVVRDKVSLYGTLTAGSYNSYKQSLGLSSGKGRTDYSVNYTHNGSKGFSTAYDKNGAGSFDKDGFDQHVADIRLNQQISEKWAANLYATYNHYKTDLDASAFADEKDYTVKNDNIRTGAGVRFDHNKGTLRFNYNFNYTERAYLDDSLFKSSLYVDFSQSRYIGRTHFAELYNNWKWANWELLAGADYRLNNTYQFYFSTGIFGPYDPPAWNGKMNQVSPYSSVIFSKNGFNGELGGRLNVHSEYGTNFTYTINPSWLINNNLKLFVNLYSAFKAPTLYQLFDPYAGNPGLEPEKGNIEEAGLEFWGSRSVRFRVVGFYRNTKDAIVYIYNPSTSASKYLNVAEQKNYGVETEFSYTAGKVSITANYTYTDGRTSSGYDGTGAPIGKDTSYYNLYRIPKHAVNLNVGVQVTPALYISGHLRSVSKREEFVYGAMPETLKAYTTIDLYGEYKFSKKIRLFLDLKNITDQKYFELLGYNTRRFNFTGGISFNL